MLMAPNATGLKRSRKQARKDESTASPQSKARSKKRAPPTFQEELERVAAALEQALARNDLSLFYAELRATDLPLLGPRHEAEPRGLARACFDVVHRLGGISPAVTLAFENHLYVTTALATLPLRGDTKVEARRRALLDKLVRDRVLVANTNSRIHTDKLSTFGVTVRREGAGFRADGTAAYLSLSTESDLIIFLTWIEGEGPALFVAPLKGNPEIEIGPFLFPRAMLDSDTRRVSFHSAFLSSENLLMTASDPRLPLISMFQLTWHQMLVAALYLGAAARAIEEARSFLRTVCGQNGQPLAELDGMIIDIGRMVIHYRAAYALIQSVVQTLEALTTGGMPLVPESFTQAFDIAATAKHFGTQCAEEIVREARRIIGARGFTGNHPIERLTQEVIFGTLGSEVNAFIERRIGQGALGETPFVPTGAR
jgi:alkylation response protein AidB-like acyl-CoA dehydrogenase